MSQRTLRFSAASAAVVLLLALSACGGGDSDGAAAGDDPTSAPSTTETPADPPTTEEAVDSEAPAAPAGGVTFVDTTDAAETIVVSADGFDPDSVDVAVGEVVAFTTEDGLYSVIVGDLDGYTVSSSISEYFRFDEPGSYPVKEDLTGATATVNVE